MSQPAHSTGINEQSRGGNTDMTIKKTSAKQDRKAEGMRKLAKLVAQREADDQAEKEYLDAPHAPRTSSHRSQPVRRAQERRLNASGNKDQSPRLQRGADSEQQHRIHTHARDAPKQPYSTGRSHDQPAGRPFNSDSSSDSNDELGQTLADVRRMRRKLNHIVKNPTQLRSPTPPSERLAHFTIRIPPKALERFRRAQDARLNKRTAKAQVEKDSDRDSEGEGGLATDEDKLAGFSPQHSQQNANNMDEDADADASDAEAVAELRAEDAEDSELDENTNKDTRSAIYSDSEHDASIGDDVHADGVSDSFHESDNPRGSYADVGSFGRRSLDSLDHAPDNVHLDSEHEHDHNGFSDSDQDGYATSHDSFGSPRHGAGNVRDGAVAPHPASDTDSHPVGQGPSLDADPSGVEYHRGNELSDFDYQDPRADEAGVLAHDSDFNEFEDQHSDDNWQPDEDFETYYAFERHRPEPTTDPEDTEFVSHADSVRRPNRNKAPSRRQKPHNHAASHPLPGSGEEEPESLPRKSSAKNLSASQRKRSKRAEVRHEINTFSQTSPIGKTNKRRRSESRSPSPQYASRSKRGKRGDSNVFRPDWKKTAKEREVGARHPSKPTMTRARGRSNGTTAGTTSKTARGTVRRRTTSERHWQDCAQSDGSPASENDDFNSSDDGGDRHARVAFTDADVAVTRTYALTAAARRSQMKVRVETLDDDDASETERTGRQPRNKRPRRSPSEISEDKSRSTHNVPAFIKPVLASKIIPTVLDYVGAKKYPWNLQEQGRTELLDLCQELINETCPRMDYELTKTDIIYKVIRQAVYDWRAGFANAAVSAVVTAVDEKFGPKPSRKIVKLWVRKATSAGGESLWAKPHANPEHARGALQSKYVLKVFAHHLIATTGSLHNYGYPRGALALAATAVQHIFPMFASGSFKAGKAFSAANVEHLTNGWYRKRVRRFSRKPENFAVLVRRAGKYAEASRTRKIPAGAPDVPDFFDRSSSPVRDDSENDNGSD